MQKSWCCAYSVDQASACRFPSALEVRSVRRPSLGGDTAWSALARVIFGLLDPDVLSAIDDDVPALFVAAEDRRAVRNLRRLVLEHDDGASVVAEADNLGRDLGVIHEGILRRPNE